MRARSHWLSHSGHDVPASMLCTACCQCAHNSTAKSPTKPNVQCLLPADYGIYGNGHPHLPRRLTSRKRHVHYVDYDLCSPNPGVCCHNYASAQNAGKAVSRRDGDTDKVS